MRTLRSTTLSATLAATVSSVLAAGLLLACGESDGSLVFEPAESDAAADGDPSATPDSGLVDSSPANAHDAGADGDAGEALDARAPFDGSAPTVTCAVSPCIKSLVAGERHYCATASDGVVRCWGDPIPLGAFIPDRDVPNAGATPTVLTGLTDIVDIAATSQRTCVVHATGIVDCFGAYDTPTPTPLSNVADAKKLAIGDQRSCVVKTNGELFCWGWSWGWGTTDLTMPLAGEQAVAAAAGQSVGFAIGSSGTVYSWGSDLRLLARETPYSQDQTPAPVTGVPAARQLVSSNGSVLALGTNGHLFGWGSNFNGVLGSGALVASLMPEEVPFGTLEWPTQVALSPTHTCARMTDGSLYCWSATNKAGQLGYDATAGVYVPSKALNFQKSAVAVAVGRDSTCALVEDGTVQCWGDNSYGQLGQGVRDTTRHAAPVTVDFH